MMPIDPVAVAALILKLGVAVYEAIASGNTTRTVGEIFDGVGKDEAEIDRLREEAKRKFGGP